MAETIGEEIEIFDTEGTHTVTYANGIFTATSNLHGWVLKFRLLKAPSKLTEEERTRVLKYNLGKVTPEDEVSIKDMFMQNEFIEELN